MKAHRKSTTALIGPGFLLMLLLLFLSWTAGRWAIAAEGIQVESADPSTAEQATVNLDVTIKGNGFGTDSEVDFFLTGTTNPAGIVVKHVTRKGPKQLIANIDVDAEATVGDFDIQVRSSGRTGKGTELFKVTEKVTGGGNDTTPPGVVYDLTAGQPGFTYIPVTWTATANDGYDAGSGPARQCSFKYSLDGPLTDANWDSYSQIYNGGAWGAEPGIQQTLELGDLVPDSLHYVAVRVIDFAENISGVSNVEVVTTEPFPTTPWDVVEVDACPPESSGWVGFYSGLDYDPNSGNPVIAYEDSCNSQRGTKLAEWNGAGFASEIIDAAIDGNTGFAIDPTNGEPTMVGFDRGKMSFFRRAGSSWNATLIERSRALQPSLEFSGGLPAVAYRKSGKNGDESCWLARWNGAAWEQEVVDLPTRCSYPQLAFNSIGDPALAYLDDLEYTPEWDFADTLKFVYWDGGAWNVEIVDQTPTHVAFSPTLAYDPVRGDFSAAYTSQRKEWWPDGRSDSGPSQLRFCQRDADSWSCELVEEAAYDSKMSLTYDDSGTAYLAYSTMSTLKVATRASGATEWVTELVDWAAHDPSIKLGPDGIPGVVYYRMLKYPDRKSFWFATRPTP
jgi:hypothetical protein